MTRPQTLIVVLAVLGVSAAWAVARAATETSKVMGSIDIGTGERSGDLSTVNGSIHIGAKAVVGHAHAVNGTISVDAHATTAELTTVNGSIRLNEATRVTGPVTTVNGSLSVANGAEVTGGLTNVNGSIRVAAAHVGGGIDTSNGSIELGPNARVDGGIHVREDTSWFNFSFFESIPRVVIGPGSVIGGTLKFERPVKLYVSDRATIGPVQGATPIKFSGDQAPK